MDYYTVRLRIGPGGTVFGKQLDTAVMLKSPVARLARNLDQRRATRAQDRAAKAKPLQFAGNLNRRNKEHRGGNKDAITARLTLVTARSAGDLRPSFCANRTQQASVIRSLL